MSDGEEWETITNPLAREDQRRYGGDAPDMKPETRPVMYLIGDEDCGVSLHCRLCDTGGLPLAYYEGIAGNPYAEVPTAKDISDLATRSTQHAAIHEETT